MLSDNIIGFITASGNVGFRPINQSCFLEIENFEEAQKREKNFTILPCIGCAKSPLFYQMSKR